MQTNICRICVKALQYKWNRCLKSFRNSSKWQIQTWFKYFKKADFINHNLRSIRYHTFITLIQGTKCNLNKDFLLYSNRYELEQTRGLTPWKDWPTLVWFGEGQDRTAASVVMVTSAANSGHQLWTDKEVRQKQRAVSRLQVTPLGHDVDREHRATCHYNPSVCLAQFLSHLH